MYKLNAKKRDLNEKGKKLRREGFIPATIYGKNLEEPLYIQISKADVFVFRNKLSKGGILTVNLEDESVDVLFKEEALEPVSHNVEHIEFQALTRGEAMNTVSKVVIKNEDKNKNILHLQTEEIPYSAEPRFFESEVAIDVDGLEGGTVISLGDLDFAKNENIKVGLPLDTIILTIEEPVVLTDEEIEAMESAEASQETAEPEVIGETEEAESEE
ncbi:MAG: hypothetical protein Q4E36_01915 [Bacillota bacterium]|nr:hypothetical protein [Bacillota bacterium]